MAQKAYIYAKAASGRTVRIPAENYERWKKAQEEIKAGTREPDMQMVKQLASLMGGKV